MKYSNDRKLEICISDQANTESILNEVSYDLATGICNKSVAYRKMVDELAEKTAILATSINEYKKALFAEYDSFEFAIEDSDYERPE